jgi:DNA-directed RNA polymerase specialized sigma24 family protein
MRFSEKLSIVKKRRCGCVQVFRYSDPHIPERAPEAFASNLLNGGFCLEGAAMQPKEPGTITGLVVTAQRGDSEALEKLLELLLGKYRSITEKSACRLKSRIADPDDFLSEALQRLYEGLPRGQFDAQPNRESLFRLIGGISRNCFLEAWKRDHARKRGGTKQFQGLEEDIIDRTPLPDAGVLVASWIDELTDLLKKRGVEDSTAREVRQYLQLRLIGWSTESIRQTMGWTTSKTRSLSDLLQGLYREENDAAKQT